MDKPVPPQVLELKLLGCPRATWAGEAIEFPTQKTLALVCYLAVLGRGASRAELAELLWGGQGRNLRVALHRLRQLPGAAFWLQAEDEVSLHASSDLAAFEAAMQAGDFQTAINLCGDEADDEDTLLLSRLRPKTLWPLRTGSRSNALALMPACATLCAPAPKCWRSEGTIAPRSSCGKAC